ncbi:AAA family ATPase, partial [Angustibacter speluncae]
APPRPAHPLLPDAPVQRGALAAVWGPAGSPGRTTVATTLAAELAALGRTTLLADADTYAAGIAQTLGVLDEAPGLAAACRSASAGTLDATMLARLSPTVAPHLRVLTGITRADRWPELSSSSLEQVWSVAREVAAFTVVDTGFSLERDEEIVYDTLAPRRNAATLSALEAADVVLAVGAGDPVGLQRLVRGLGELAEAVPHAAPRVVVTRVRASATGSDPHRRVAEALQRYAGVTQVVTVPDDRDALDGALLAGRSLTEHAPSSPARLVVADLAALLAGNRPAAGRSGRGRRRRTPA